ncbi:MAG: hypothetical protein JO266_18850 [Acidobacteria bacterium]|nr:hypothetical protein [Acidobacteriota bacterium]MBV8893996.1 hypothetical protein [Acidobacteriota bacterium]
MAIAAIIISWAGLNVLGFALVYLPHLGTQYVFATGIDPAHVRGSWGALSDSLGSMITLAGGCHQIGLARLAGGL